MLYIYEMNYNSYTVTSLCYDYISLFNHSLDNEPSVCYAYIFDTLHKQHKRTSIARENILDEHISSSDLHLLQCPLENLIIDNRVLFKAINHSRIMYAVFD